MSLRRREPPPGVGTHAATCVAHAAVSMVFQARSVHNRGPAQQHTQHERYTHTHTHTHMHTRRCAWPTPAVQAIPCSTRAGRMLAHSLHQAQSWGYKHPRPVRWLCLPLLLASGSVMVPQTSGMCIDVKRIFTCIRLSPGATNILCLCAGIQVDAITYLHRAPS